MAVRSNSIVIHLYISNQSSGIGQSIIPSLAAVLTKARSQALCIYFSCCIWPLQRELVASLGVCTSPTP